MGEGRAAPDPALREGRGITSGNSTAKTGLSSGLTQGMLSEGSKTREGAQGCLGKGREWAEESSSVSVSFMVPSLEPHGHQRVVCECGREGRKKGRRRMENPGSFPQAKRGPVGNRKPGEVSEWGNNACHLEFPEGKPAAKCRLTGAPAPWKGWGGPLSIQPGQRSGRKPQPSASPRAGEAPGCPAAASRAKNKLFTPTLPPTPPYPHLPGRLRRAYSTSQKGEDF